MNIRKILLCLSLVSITACGLVNDFGVVGKNLKRLLGTHPYAVNEGEEEQILKSGKAIVSLYFTNNLGTAWMRIDENGNIDPKNYTLTYSEFGSMGRRKSQLEPGTYFLNGVVANNEGMTGYYVRSTKMESFGWDKEKNEAKCFSFTVKAGETLVIPDIEYLGLLLEENNICPKLSYTVKPSDNAQYKIGKDSEF